MGLVGFDAFTWLEVGSKFEYALVTYVNSLGWTYSDVSILIAIKICFAGPPTKIICIKLVESGEVKPTARYGLGVDYNLSYFSGVVVHLIHRDYAVVYLGVCLLRAGINEVECSCFIHREYDYLSFNCAKYVTCLYVKLQ